MLNSAQKLFVIRFFSNIHAWTLNTEPLEDRSEETSASVASISCSSLVSVSALRLLLMLFRISRCFFCNSCDSLHDSLVTAYLQHELLQLVLHITFLGWAPGLRALRCRALRLLLGPDCVLESAVLIKILDQMLLQSLLLVVK